MSGRPQTWPTVASWVELNSVVRVAAPPFVTWLGLTLLISILVSDAVRSSIYSMSGFQGGSVGAGFVEGFISAGTGAIGSLLAGLGFQLGAGGQAGALGTQTKVDIGVTLGMVPLSTLAIFALLTARGSRQMARQRSAQTLQEYVGPALLAAAGTALAIYLGALLLSSSIGGNLSSFSDSGGLATTVRGGPTLSGLLFLLFPTLAIGSVVGAMDGGGWPLLTARFAPQLATPSLARVVAWAPLLLYAVAGYLGALVVGSVVGLVLLVVFAITNGADLLLVLRLLPGLAVTVPNGIAALILAGTGTQIGLATTGAAGQAVPTMGSLWDAPVEWIVAGIVMLLIPGLLAGIVTRGRMPMAMPGVVAAVGALTGLLALTGALVAVPSFGASGTVFVAQTSAGTRLIFDLGQAIIVGGALIVGATLVGFRFGGAVAPRVSRIVPR